MKLIMVIFLLAFMNGCINFLPRCDTKELCHYSHFYDSVTPQLRRLNFEKLNYKDQVAVFIYGVKYRHHMPYDVVSALERRDPSVLPVLIGMVEQYSTPYTRKFAIDICESIITHYPEVESDSRVIQFIMESKKIVLQAKVKEDKIMKDYYEQLRFPTKTGH